jgi:hypothetical protein
MRLKKWQRITALILLLVLETGALGACIAGIALRDWSGPILAFALSVAGFILPILILQHDRDDRGRRLARIFWWELVFPKKPSVPPDKWKF